MKREMSVCFICYICYNLNTSSVSWLVIDVRVAQYWNIITVDLWAQARICVSYGDLFVQ